MSLNPTFPYELANVNAPGQFSEHGAASEAKNGRLPKV
jgi:hypothetical protein